MNTPSDKFKTLFAGDKKVGESFLTSLEKKIVAWGVPKIPSNIETYHLTFATVLWSLGVVFFGYLTRYSLSWIWMISVMIIAQYVTDLFDGAVGRHRQTGLIKWGFFMDHFLDFIFICSLAVAGYFIAPEGLTLWYFSLLIVLSCFMVISFLSFATTNKFEIYHHGFGPTEFRLVLVIINTLIFYTGTDHFCGRRRDDI